MLPGWCGSSVSPFIFSLPRSQQVRLILVYLLGLWKGFPSLSPFLPG